MTSPPGLPAALRCLALDDAAVRVCAALRDQEIDSVLLKGAGLAWRLGMRRQRLYADVDLLVAPTAFEAAQAVLAALGYRPTIPDSLIDDWSHWYERSWRSSGPVPLTVDLHRGFAGVGEPEAFWLAVWSVRELIDLAGGTVAVPDPACTALLAALHAAAPGGFAKPSADLARAVEVLPPAAWRAAADIAGRCAASSAFAVGLRVVPAGRAMADNLGLPSQWRASQWIAAHRGTATAHTLARLAELPTLRLRARHFGRRLFPSPVAMRRANALARRGPSGLALAYAGRLARHVWRLPQASRELRMAWRSTRG